MTAWLGTEYFLAAVVALFVVDKLGRRNLMMFGAGKSCCCCCCSVVRTSKGLHNGLTIIFGRWHGPQSVDHRSYALNGKNERSICSDSFHLCL